MKKVFLNILRVAISIGLLVYLVLLADINKIIETLKIVNPGLFGLALLAFFICLLILSTRWKTLLDQFDIHPKFGLLLNFYFIGYFFNNFLPTSIGGDVSRAYNVAKVSGKKASSVGAILLERMMGMLATLTLASLSMFWVIRYFHTTKIIYVTITMLIIVIFILINLLHPATFNFTSRVLSKITIFHLGDKINRVLGSIHSYRENKMAIVRAFILSLMSQTTLIFMNYILAKALNLDHVSLGFLFIVIPVTFLLSLLPSINGLGVRDLGYVSLLTRIGVTPAEALSLSFLNTLVPIIHSLYGGLLLIFYRHKQGFEDIGKIESEMD